MHVDSRYAVSKDSSVNTSMRQKASNMMQLSCAASLPLRFRPVRLSSSCPGRQLSTQLPLWSAASGFSLSSYPDRLSSRSWIPCSDHIGTVHDGPSRPPRHSFVRGAVTQGGREHHTAIGPGSTRGLCSERLLCPWVAAVTASHELAPDLFRHAAKKTRGPLPCPPAASHSCLLPCRDRDTIPSRVIDVLLLLETVANPASRREA